MFHIYRQGQGNIRLQIEVRDSETSQLSLEELCTMITNEQQDLQKAELQPLRRHAQDQ